jgi:hypothetical protein
MHDRPRRRARGKKCHHAFDRLRNSATFDINLLPFTARGLSSRKSKVGCRYAYNNNNGRSGRIPLVDAFRSISRCRRETHRRSSDISCSAVDEQIPNERTGTFVEQHFPAASAVRCFDRHFRLFTIQACARVAASGEL